MNYVLIYLGCLGHVIKDGIQKRIRKVKDDFVARENGKAILESRESAFAQDKEKIDARKKQELLGRLQEKVDTMSREDKVRSSFYSVSFERTLRYFSFVYLFHTIVLFENHLF